MKKGPNGRYSKEFREEAVKMVTEGGVIWLALQQAMSPYVALIRRSQKHSNLSAVVFKFSKARKRNERQGIFVEIAALKEVEKECLDDEKIRRRNRKRDSVRRERIDREYIQKFSEKI